MKNADQLIELSTKLTDSVMTLCVGFATKSEFPKGTTYEESRRVVIAGMVNALAVLVSGAVGDPEDEMDAIVSSLGSSATRALMAANRKVFLDTLALNGRELKHHAPRKAPQ